jgi:hypothetical protein
VLCLTDQFFDAAVYEKAASLTKEAASEAIRAQVLKLNPAANPKQIEKFIRG